MEVGYWRGMLVGCWRRRMDVGNGEWNSCNGSVLVATVLVTGTVYWYSIGLNNIGGRYSVLVAVLVSTVLVAGTVLVALMVATVLVAGTGVLVQQYWWQVQCIGIMVCEGMCK